MGPREGSPEAGAPCGPPEGERSEVLSLAPSRQPAEGSPGTWGCPDTPLPAPPTPLLSLSTEKCCRDPPGPAEEGRAGMGPAPLAELRQETLQLGLFTEGGSGTGAPPSAWARTRAALF